MAATVGITGLITGASGTWNTLLARMSPAAFTLTESGQEFDKTEFASASGVIPRGWSPGLRTFGVTVEAFSATPVTGITGTLSGTDYATNPFEWDMTINQAALDVTDFGVSSAWRAFAPGLQDWSGSFSAFIDGTTAISSITAGGASPTLAAATFTISSGNTLAGNIFTRALSGVVAVGDRNIVRYEYRGDSNLTVAGTDAILAANSGTMVALPSSSLVMTAATGRTYTGSVIPTSIQITVRQGELTRIRAVGQGTSSLVIA